MSEKGMVRLPYDRKFCLGDYAPMSKPLGSAVGTSKLSQEPR